MLGQLITAGHEHHDHDATSATECVMCAQASSNDDLDVPDSLDIATVEFSGFLHSEAKNWQYFAATVEIKARAPPNS
nr:hypothetical protein [Parasphingorhabdus marina]